jgi:hypothetical protein
MATGTIYESSGSFYVRYSVGMTVSKNGKPRPIQKSHRLCEKNDKYYSSKARQGLLRDAFMLTVNTRQAHAIAEDMTITAFWERRYLPYCKETLQLTGRPRKKPSTIWATNKSGASISSLTLVSAADLSAQTIKTRLSNNAAH